MTIKDKKYHHNIDLLGLILKNWQVQTLTADPATTYARVYYNSVLQKFRSYNPDTVSWSDLGSGLAADSVDNTILSNMAQATVKGRAVGAGTGDPTDLTAAQVKTLLAIVAADLSDFNTAVRTNRLDQMTAPSASVSMNSQKIISLADGTAAADAVNLNQVQGLINTGTNKTAVRAGATTNTVIASALENGDSFGGVTLATGERVVLMGQTAPEENGIYIVPVSGAASRATDADISAEVKGGLSVWINEGTLADTRWVITTNDPIVLGTTGLVFVQDFKATSTTAGAGLVVNGPALDVGQGTGITVNTNDVAIDSSVVVRKFAATIGDNSATDFVVNHALATRDVTVQVYDAASPFSLQSVYLEATDTNNVTIFFPTAPTTNQYRVVVKA